MSSPVGPVQEQYKVVSKSGPAPVNIAEYERFAQDHLARNAFDYYASGSNDMITLRENRDAFARLRLLPRVLIDVSKISTETTVLGEKVSSPICIAPTAMQKMAHPDGECATARAAAKQNTLMCLSSWSTTALEEVNDAAPQGLKWFQLYVYKDRKVTRELIKRAEKAGYKALAVTVDTPALGRREADIKNQFSLPSHLTMGNFSHLGGEHAEGTSKAKKSSSGSSGSSLASYVASLIDKTLTWEDISWLRTQTTMKIVVKGVITPEDALIALKYGVDGIWISNHGARQLDTTPATIEAVPDIIRAVGGRCEVYVDGGITRGTDALKAIAMGCKAVFIGRPVLWGLTHSGEQGVFNVLQLLKDEFTLAMMLAGAVKIDDLKPSLVRPALAFQSRL